MTLLSSASPYRLSTFFFSELLFTALLECYLTLISRAQPVEQGLCFSVNTPRKPHGHPQVESDFLAIRKQNLFSRLT